MKFEETPVFCKTDCPFFRYELQEKSVLPTVLYVYCKFYKNGREPMLSLADEQQIAVVMAQMVQADLILIDVDCIAPQVWHKSE